jgi:carbon-monoxide dehydrogenase catalytic subunit
MPEKVSAHKSIEEMYKRVHTEGLTNVFDRYEAQGARCPFCAGGIRCALCSNGPCRIKPGADRGVCGIEANAMAMRNMLIRNILGTATYTYHAQETTDTLHATAKGEAPFQITNEARLRTVAEKLGLDTSLATNELAESLADFFAEELARHRHQPLRILEAFAPEERRKCWDALGLTPGGALQELMRATSSCLTNVDADYKSLALKAMRLSLACIYGAEIPLELGQDILFGTPTPHEAEVDLGVLDPDYVNILPNGHQPFVGAALISEALKEETQILARKAGAKGLCIIGSIETGQELLQRFSPEEGLSGFTGNWLAQEMVLATGAVDVFATDMNCTIPTLGLYGKRFGAKVVPVSELVRVEHSDEPMDYRPEKVAEQARALIHLAIQNFKERKAKGKPQVPEIKTKIMTGFSTESILSALGGSLNPLLDAIKNGDVKGVAALVSCTTLKNGPQDSLTIAVAKELIKRDILILGMGCGVAGLQLGGLCSLDALGEAGKGLKAVCGGLGVPPVLGFGTCTDTGRCALLVTAVAQALGVPVPQLPVAVTAPEYMEQKATIDAIFAITFGLYTHVSPVPPVTGAPKLVKLLTEDVEGLTGGKLALGDDAGEVAEGIENHINNKRAELGI